MANTFVENEEYITTPIVSQRARVHPKTVDNWRKRGLPFIKCGKSVRFRWSSVQAWLAAREITASDASNP